MCEDFNGESDYFHRELVVNQLLAGQCLSKFQKPMLLANQASISSALFSMPYKIIFALTVSIKATVAKVATFYIVKILSYYFAKSLSLLVFFGYVSPFDDSSA